MWGVILKIMNDAVTLLKELQTELQALYEAVEDLKGGSWRDESLQAKLQQIQTSIDDISSYIQCLIDFDMGGGEWGDGE